MQYVCSAYFIGTCAWTWSFGISLPGLTSFTNQLQRYTCCLGRSKLLYAVLKFLEAIFQSYYCGTERVKTSVDVWGMDSGSKLFECVELFRVNESLSDGEHSNEGKNGKVRCRKVYYCLREGTLAQNSVTIELSCWKEVETHSTLIVVCSNGEPLLERRRRDNVVTLADFRSNQITSLSRSHLRAARPSYDS